MELALFDSTWAKSFGYPKIIRMDASGPHQGELFAEWASNHGIKVNLIPSWCSSPAWNFGKEPCRETKDAGNFQGRSSNCSFEQALLATAHQRNRLSSVKAQRQPLWHLAMFPLRAVSWMSLVLKLFGDQADLPRIMEIKTTGCNRLSQGQPGLGVESCCPPSLNASKRMSLWWVTGFSIGSLKLTSWTPSDGETSTGHCCGVHHRQSHYHLLGGSWQLPGAHNAPTAQARNST